MKKYPKYKDSGVEWIGEIPEDWNIGKLKFLSKIRRGSSPRPIDDPKYFDDENGEYYWIRISDLTKSGRYLYNTEQKLSELGSSLSYKLNSDELVMSISGSVGKVIITKTKCCIHDGFVVFQNLKPVRDYLYYIITNPDLYTEDGKLGTQFNINSDIVGNKYIPLFSILEQQQIVEFLDYKTSLIDTLIQKKQRKIELLKEQRTSIINHTVTKGLNHNVKMKDSGVEWIGEIPEHWEMVKLKYLGKSLIGLSYQPDDVVDDESKGLLVLRSSNIQNGKLSLNDNVYVKSKVKDDIIVKEGDILICSRNGSRSLIGKNITIPKELEGNTFGVFMTVFRTPYWKFLSMIFNSQIFINQSGLFLTSTINQLTQDTLNNFVVPYTHIEKEQLDIYIYLDKKTTEIDTTITLENKKIDLLKEYRQSLISEVVTGKIDVRKN